MVACPSTKRILIVMGYGIILSLDDKVVRDTNMTADALIDHLRAVVGDDTYPAGQPEARASGPWQSPGAWHSTSTVWFEATGTGITPVSDQPKVPHTGLFQPALTARAHSDAAKQLRSRPDLHAKAVARGDGDVVTGMFGPDRTANSVRSIWWFYADAAGSITDDMGERILASLTTREICTVTAGPFSNALNKLGSVLTDDPVTVCWSGNGLQLPADL